MDIWGVRWRAGRASLPWLARGASASEAPLLTMTSAAPHSLYVSIIWSTLRQYR